MNSLLDSWDHKKPIFIASSYRTGSTALGKLLSNQTGFSFYSEPNRYRMTEYLEHSRSKDDFIVKVHASEIEAEHHRPIDRHYVILLKRKNPLDQIFSQYIAIKRSMWFYFTDKITEEVVHCSSVSVNSNATDNEILRITQTDVDIDKDLMKRCIQSTLVANNVLNNFESIFRFIPNKAVFYEDLAFDNTFIKTPSVSNKEEILNILTPMYNEIVNSYNILIPANIEKIFYRNKFKSFQRLGARSN